MLAKLGNEYDDVIYSAIELITDELEKTQYMPVSRKLKIRKALFDAIKNYDALGIEKMARGLIGDMYEMSKDDEERKVLNYILKRI